jgi:hypothetical protein
MLLPPTEVLAELRRRLRELDAPPDRLNQLSFDDLQKVLIGPFRDYFLPAWLHSALPAHDATDRETARIEARRLRDEIILEIVGGTLDEVSVEGIEKLPPPWEKRPLTAARIRPQVEARHGYLEREIPYHYRHIFRLSRAWTNQQLEEAVPPAEIETIAFMYPTAMAAGSVVTPAAATISTNSRVDLWPLLEILKLSVPAWSARTVGIVPEDPASLDASSIYAYLNERTRHLRPANERKLYLVLQATIKATLAGHPSPGEQQVLQAWLGTPLPK